MTRDYICSLFNKLCIESLDGIVLEQQFDQGLYVWII